MLFAGNTLLAVVAVTALGSVTAGRGIDRPRKDSPRRDLPRKDLPRKERPTRKGHPSRSLIVGGSPADFADYPFFVDLYGCAGTLIWKDIVLTAAHCNRPDFLGYADVGPDFEERTLVSSTMHPDYNSATQENDIWVAKLDYPIDMDLSSATLVDLNSNAQVPGFGAGIEIIGVGLTYDGDFGSFNKAIVQEVPLAQCQSAYSQLSLAVTDSEFCAAADGSDACKGDSGGPALVGNTQVGIISQGFGCADSAFPGIYARVSEAYPWIKHQICCQSADPPDDCPPVAKGECQNDLQAGGACWSERDDIGCYGRWAPSNTIEGCKGNTGLTGDNEPTDFRFYDSGDGNCVEVPGVTLPPTCYTNMDQDTGVCYGGSVPSIDGTVDGCKDVTQFTEPGRSVDLPFFDSGDGNCVMVPGGSPLVDCCKTDQCAPGFRPGIPGDPTADCAVTYNLNNCPEGYNSYFYDYELGSCNSISSDTGGDPHIQTFDGKYFDYHGACDLVLVSAPEFDLDIHIRTTSRYQYSYIESAVLRIGGNTLEVSSWGEHALDGIGGVDLSIENAKLAQFPIYHTQPPSDSSGKHHVFDVVVGAHQNITLSTFKDLVSVKITEGSKAIFGDSVGLMGSFSGELHARDGTTMSVEGDSANAFGQEWQVKPDEPMLFRSARAPFAGEKCLLPSETKQRQRRLGEATVAKNDAERVCSRFTGAKLENCVFDVMAVGDLDFANSL